VLADLVPRQVDSYSNGTEFIQVVGQVIRNLFRRVRWTRGSDEDEEIPPTLYVAVNPKITRFSRETVVGAEGCLSIPGLMGEVERAQTITVEAQDRRGEAVKLRLNGWTARIFQH
jgi:peptide deformylase